MKNIVLTGLRGSGKSKIGKLISERLKLDFIDLDKEIEKYEGKSIPEIFAKKGWKYFREIEKKVVKKIAKEKNKIISTGGGTIIYEENYKNLKKNGIIIYLKRSPADCYKYISKDKNRPPLTNEKNPLKEIKKIYKERKPFYEKTADIIFKRSDDVKKDTKKMLKNFIIVKA
ncbi:MAG: shikimate kinase [Candidatus Gracilibacteria bacterium]|jgi:shikimate kinase